jgi:hypothetical protein
MKPQIIIAALLLPIMFDGTAKAHDDDNTSDRGWLGVSIKDMTPRLARSMDVKTEEGALVNDVVDDSPAKTAGILNEDIIIEFNGRNIYDADDLMRAVSKTESGKEVDVVVMRKGEKKNLRVTVGKYPRERKSYSYSFRAPKAPRMVFACRNSTSSSANTLEHPKAEECWSKKSRRKAQLRRPASWLVMSSSRLAKRL